MFKMFKQNYTFLTFFIKCLFINNAKFIKLIKTYTYKIALHKSAGLFKLTKHQL
jgi:hypothetical protein